MLEFLHIENIAVAKNVEIDFRNGFNVLTGETGAGKSIVIDSINMLQGAKVSKEIIRHGESRAVVSALFADVSDEVYDICDEMGISYDREDSFSLSRTITVEGKNTIKINSRPATLAQLKSVGSALINIHGQNENQSFLNKNSHILMLDDYIGIESIILEYKAQYKKLCDIKAEINSLYEESKEKNMMVDILNYQIKEIDSAKLKSNDEEEKLSELKRKLKGAEHLVKQTSIVYRALLKSESGVHAKLLIEKAIDALERLSDIEPEADEMAEKLRNICFEIEDIAEKTKDLGSLDGISNPQKQLEIVEDRLALINKLEKKYGPTIQDVINFRNSADEKLKRFESSEERIEELKDEYRSVYKKCCDIAREIHKARLNGAISLGNIVKDALMFLDMPKVQFEIKVQEQLKDDKYILSQHGYDDVEFLIATNAGEELAPMNKIASGGELARIMLALKSALSDKNGAQTIIFDEIDTGVSGSTSQKIGIKLANISKNVQVVCVTHSAQIAAFANNHFFIKKNEIDGRAETTVSLLDENERIDELARIIGGINLTDNQYAAAKELIIESKSLIEW